MGAYGWKGQVGWTKEGSYGGGGTVDNFAEYRSENIRRVIPFGHDDVIQGDRLPHKLHHRRSDKYSTEGDIVLPLLLEDQLLLFEAALGGREDAQIATTSAYRHTFTLANTLPSLVAEIGRDTRFFTYKGLKVQSLQIVIDNANEFCEMTITFLGDGSQSDAESGETASYSTNQRIWTPRDMTTFKIGGADKLADVWRFTLNIEHQFNQDERAYGFKQERQRLDEVGRVVVSGEITMAFKDMTEVDAIKNETNRKLEVVLEGADIEADNNETLSIEAEVARYDGNEPETPGIEEEIVLDLEYRVLDDEVEANEPLEIDIINRDTEGTT